MAVMHSVYFTLKDGSPKARQALVDGCKTYLEGHAGQLFFSSGTRREDHVRDVNDRDFHVSLHIVFKDKPAHDAYQVSPRHAEFIKHLSAGWERVRVFDSDVEVSR